MHCWPLKSYEVFGTICIQGRGLILSDLYEYQMDVCNKLRLSILLSGHLVWQKL